MFDFLKRIEIRSHVKPKIEARYAESTIDDINNFDAIEIHGLCKYIDRDGSECYATPEDDEDQPDMYGVFVHLVNGGIDCCGDFSRRADAVAYAQELADLYSWSIYDYIPPRFTFSLRILMDFGLNITIR